jgi:hypothetical protein
MLKIESLEPTLGAPPIAKLPAWFRPALFIAVPVSLSFGAWIISVSVRPFQPASASLQALLGFGTPAHPTVRGVVLLLIWFFAVIAAATIGWRLGSDRTPNARIVRVAEKPAFARRYFYLVLLVAIGGIGYSYYKITRNASILESLANQSGNDFTNSLSGSTGIETLRYAAILAAPLGFYLWRRKVIRWPFMLVGVLLLAANALIASRLGLLMASVVFLALWARNAGASPSRWRTSQKIFAAVLIAVLGFAALGVLNYFRNANYYRAAGVTNPAAMNLYQMGSYLAVPAQVSIGVSNAVMSGAWENPGDPVTSFNAIQPTFLQFAKVTKDNSWKGADVYGYSVTFAPQLFTNSVFADTYADWGAWGWPYTVLLYGLAGYGMCRLLSYPGVIAGSGGVLAYCFSEVWRIQIVSYGIVIFLLLLTVGCAVVATYLTEREERLSTS